MRVSIIIGICLILVCIGISTSGHAQMWCSFEPGGCGYSNPDTCRQLAEASGCLLDPEFGALAASSFG
jgi:hypothetical protein